MSRAELEAFTSSPLARFRSWRTLDGRSPQGEFIAAAATNLRRIFRSGNRVGKTTCGAVDTLLHLLGWHPCGKHQAPVRWWVSGLSWEVVGEVLWPTIREFLPMEQVRHIAWMRKADPQIPLAITFRNGSELRFKSADAGREKYQGAKLHGVWIDEEQPEDIVEECRARLMDYGGYLTVTLTPLKRARWVREIEAEAESQTFRASMREAAEAGLLDIEEVERYARALPERQRRVRVDGDFVALEGMVYPDLNRETHAGYVQAGQLIANGQVIAPWPLPASWPRWAAIDWGYVNPTACVIACEDPRHGRLIIERCYYASSIRASAWAPLLRDRLPALRVPLISDHDAQARAELEAFGIYTTAADKDISTGLEAVERLLVKDCADGAPGLIFVVDESADRVLGRCDSDRVLWEAESYHYAAARPGRPDVKDIPVKKDDHALDALRYLVVAFGKSSGGAPKPPEFKPPKRERSQSLKMPKGAWI